VLDKAEYSAFQSTLNSSIVSYRIIKIALHNTSLLDAILATGDHQTVDYILHQSA